MISCAILIRSYTEVTSHRQVVYQKGIFGYTDGMKPVFLKPPPIHIRDPLHGSIPISERELRLIDQPAFQRLRNIKQLGFSDFAFPGATHSRYSHSLGAMHLASRIFDRLFSPGDLPEPLRLQLRQLVRLAMLFHDVGHAPLSHTTEGLMPSVGALKLSEGFAKEPKRQATHEDYTIKILLDSPITEVIVKLFNEEGVSPARIVALLTEETPFGSDLKWGGNDLAPLLRQIISSECDADRMDYLQRDSFYCGVNYGKFDMDWLVDNLLPIQKENAFFLGLRSKAIFSFEDFLISRYHMFASVYFHHTPVIFEQMLAKYIATSQGEFALPADVEQYIRLDDMDIWQALRKSQNPWAKRIVERQPYHLLHEARLFFPEQTAEMDSSVLCQQLAVHGVDYIQTKSHSVLSKYVGRGEIPLYVAIGSGQVVSLESYTPLYKRYQAPAQTDRVYVHPDDKSKSKEILRQLIQGHVHP